MPSFLKVSTIYSKYSCTYRSSLGGRFKILFHFVDRFPIVFMVLLLSCVTSGPSRHAHWTGFSTRDQSQLTGPKEVVFVKERRDQPSLGMLPTGPKALE